MKVIVTGGGGFVGKALCRELGKAYEVISIARNYYPDLEALNVKQYKLDLSQGGFVDEASLPFRGAEAVFHTAAKVDMWGKPEDFHSVNVIGTENLLKASIKYGVKYFIFTSSPSVISQDKDLCGVNEEIPYPQKFYSYYARTKAYAEQRVLKANSTSFLTVALRPHLIWGPGDRHFIPTVLTKAAQRRLIIVGSGENLVDVSFIDDCVSAHILALEALKKGKKEAAGRAFFISQGEPVKLWDWLGDIIRRHGLPLPKKKIPLKVGKTVGSFFEKLSCLSGYKIDPPLTRFLAMQMAHSHYFDISAAKQILGYCPSYSVTKALEMAFPLSKEGTI